MFRWIKKYKSFDSVILVDKLAVVGGAFKSIMGYYKFKNKDEQKVLFLSRSDRYLFIKHLLVLFFSPRVLVNSLSSFNSWSIILIAFLRPDLVLYLHETETAVNSFKKRGAFKYYILTKILKRNKIACVSLYQQNYYEKEFGSDTILIYDYYTSENVTLPRNEERKIILMAGYLMERKGVSFYSKIADYVLNELKLPWDFYWAGSKASNDKMYQSDNVIWLGDVELMDFLYPQIDAFILTSIDEPSGLVCIEALKYYKHVIAYKNAGSSEVIKTVKGCKVYYAYEIDAAVNAMLEAFEEEIDKGKIDYIMDNIVSTKSFVKRVDQLFSK